MDQSKITTERQNSTQKSTTSSKKFRKSRKTRRHHDWEILEGLKEGIRYDKKPEKFSGYLMKRRRWPLKGWHKVLHVHLIKLNELQYCISHLCIKNFHDGWTLFSCMKWRAHLVLPDSISNCPLVSTGNLCGFSKQAKCDTCIDEKNP